MKKHALVLVAATLVVASLLVFGAPSIADAHPLATLLADPYAIFTAPVIALPALRTELDGLVTRAATKFSEIKDGMPAEQLRAIEDDHKKLLADIEKKRAEIVAAEAEEKTRAAAAAAAPGQVPAIDPAVIATAVREAVTAERTRVDGIRGVAKRFGQVELGDEHIGRGTNLGDFRNAVMEKLAATDGEIRILPLVETGGGRQDETQTRRDGAVNALLHRHDPRQHPLTDAGRQFRGMTLLEMARDCLESSGVRTRGMARDEVAKRGFHSTSDFPYVLEAVTNKTLRSAYEAYPSTFRPFCRQVNATDFKMQNRVQLGEAPQLEKVNEHGEFKRGTIKEGKEAYKIDTYGKVVAITRQVIINDDLGAFTRIPQMFGIAIGTLESDIVWSIITTNANMADGNPLFHANHGNLIAAGGGAPSVTTVGATRTLMRKQKGLDGKTKINPRPAFILVPSELETATEQLFAAIVAAQTSAVVPESIRSLKPLAEPRLSDVSATAWYLAADPNTGNVDTIEFAYLEGQEGAYIETRMGFDVDGMEVKCRLDFGAKAIDWKGLAKNPGA
jgi:hypothetical protein